MDEAITSTNALEKSKFSTVVEEAGIVPRNIAIAVEDVTESEMLKAK
jgi:hypothetical protein